jgi:hypothetical protein
MPEATNSFCVFCGNEAVRMFGSHFVCSSCARGAQANISTTYGSAQVFVRVGGRSLPAYDAPVGVGWTLEDIQEKAEKSLRNIANWTSERGNLEY